MYLYLVFLEETLVELTRTKDGYLGKLKYTTVVNSLVKVRSDINRNKRTKLKTTITKLSS